MIMKQNYILDHVRISPDRQIGEHFDERWELSLVIVGSGVRTLGNDTEPFNGGDLVLVPPDIPHCWNFDLDDTDSRGKIENITLLFNEKLIDNIILAFPGLMDRLISFKNNGCAIVYYGDAKERISALMKKMVMQSDAYRSATLLEILVNLSEYENCRSISYQQKSDFAKERLSKIKIYVSCNYMKRITIDEISGYVGMQRSSFCVFFRKEMGDTFTNYVNSVRMTNAAMLLKRGTMTVSEVCWDSGFNNLASFSRMFKRWYGVSPSDYVKNK